jgi:hypothetical protein
LADLDEVAQVDKKLTFLKNLLILVKSYRILMDLLTAKKRLAELTRVDLVKRINQLDDVAATSGLINLIIN